MSLIVAIVVAGAVIASFVLGGHALFSLARGDTRTALILGFTAFLCALGAFAVSSAF